jgi:hypothetical protein
LPAIARPRCGPRRIEAFMAEHIYRNDEELFAAQVH